MERVVENLLKNRGSIEKVENRLNSREKVGKRRKKVEKKRNKQAF